MNANKKTAKAAGVLYLTVIVTGMFSLAYVTQKLIDWDSGTATFNTITASPLLFRLGIYSSVLCYVAFTFLPLVLYKLLIKVNGSHARAMVILALISVPLSFNNLQHIYAALALTGKVSLLQDASIEDLQSKLMFSLNQYTDGLLFATVFWSVIDVRLHWLFDKFYRQFFSWKLFKNRNREIYEYAACSCRNEYMFLAAFFWFQNKE